MTKHDPLDALRATLQKDTPTPLTEAAMQSFAEEAFRASAAETGGEAPLSKAFFGSFFSSEKLAFAMAALALLALGWGFLRSSGQGEISQNVIQDTERLEAAPDSTAPSKASLKAAPTMALDLEDLPEALTRRSILGELAQVSAEGTADYEVDKQGSDVRVHLHSGALLFDVAPLKAGQEFVVESGDVTIFVVGTVFSVQREGDFTQVNVFEGKVKVTRASDTQFLGKGEVFQEEQTAGVSLPEALRDLGIQAAQQRESARLEEEPVVTVEPRVVNNKVQAPPPEALRAEIRRVLKKGRYPEALELAQAALEARPNNSSLLVLAGDCARAAQRTDEAIVYYRRAATSGSLVRSQAGFLAAQLELTKNTDALGALNTLSQSGAALPGAALEEEALALQVRALHRLGRDLEARRVIKRYLERFPEGSHAASFREHAR